MTNVLITDFTRRNLFLSASAVALTHAATLKPAEAQSFDSIRDAFFEIFQSALAKLENALEAFIQVLEDGTEPKPDAALQQIEACRSELAKIPQDQTSRDLARVEQLALYDDMARNDVSPNPSRHDLIEPDQGVEPEGDSFASVFFDILWQSWGIDKATRGSFNDVVGRLGVDDLVKTLRTEVSKGNWARAERVIEQILRKLFGRAGLAEFSRSLAPAAYRRLLISLSARAVPFVGWLLFAVSFGTAIYVNRERLLSLP